MATQQQIAVYLVDVSGSMDNGRLDNCKKFITSMKDTPDRFTIYTYGSSPKQTSYDEFINMPAKGKTQIERAVNEMFTNYLLKEKSNLVDFVLLTDAEDKIKNENALKSNMTAAIKQYNDAGGKLDTSAVFVLKDGNWNDTANKIKGAFGGGDVYDNETLDKKLEETQAGIKECNDVRNVYMKCKTEIDVIKQIFERSKSDKEDEKELVGKVDKETQVIGNDMKNLENEMSGLLSADFLKEFDNGKVNKSESKTDETEKKRSDSIDNALQEIDNQENIKIEKIKEGWVVGSKCEIFSKANQKWMEVQITKIFTHQDKEWLEVNNLKEIPRFDKDIRPIQKENAELWLKLIKISEKLEQICSNMDININKLKTLVINETAQSTIKQFEDLESLLNNVTIQSVQSKVNSMKNDLIEAKKDILKLITELEKKASKTDINVNDVNKQIYDLQQKKTRIIKIQVKIEKQIDDLLKKEIKFIDGDMTKYKKQIVENVLKECMRSNCMKVSQIGDKLKHNYMKVLVIAEGYMDIDVRKYESDTYESGKWKCGKFGNFDIMNIKLLSDDQCNALYNAKQMEEKCDKYIDEMIQSIENCEINAKHSHNTIDEKFNAIIDSANKRRHILHEQLKQLENKKLKLYDNNLKKGKQMKKELKEVQIDFDNKFQNKKILEQERIRKHNITSDSENACKKAESLFKDEIEYSLDEEFDVKVKSVEMQNNIDCMGIVTAKDMMPEITISSVWGTDAKIEIKYKYEKHALLYALEYKEVGKNENNYENVFMDDNDVDEKKDIDDEKKDTDDEKKDTDVTYMESKEKTFVIKNLKCNSKYCVRSKIKIAENYWTSYSENKTFDTHSFQVVECTNTGSMTQEQRTVVKDVLKGCIGDYHGKATITTSSIKNKLNANGMKAIAITAGKVSCDFAIQSGAEYMRYSTWNLGKFGVYSIIMVQYVSNKYHLECTSSDKSMNEKQKNTIKNAIKNCIDSGNVTHTSIRDKLNSNGVKSISLTAGRIGTQYGWYNGNDTLAWSSWDCGKHGIYDIITINQSKY